MTVVPREGFFQEDSMFDSVTTYLHDAVEELNHVRWPTRQQALRLSVICIGFCTVAALAFGLVDMGLSSLVKLLLSLTPYSS
jgi:preprotein translocase SecE subunit